MKVGGYFFCVHRGPDGRLKSKQKAKNAWTNEGLAWFIDYTFLMAEYVNMSASQRVSFGLIDNVGFTALANADTAASHPGWAEIISGYNSPGAFADRAYPLSIPLAEDTGDIKTIVAQEIFITSSMDIRGAFLCPSEYFPDIEVLYCHAEFPVVVEVSGGDTLSLTYLITLTE